MKSRELGWVKTREQSFCPFEVKNIPIAPLLRITEERSTKRIYHSDRLWVRCDLMREMDRTVQFEVTVL